MNGLDTDLRPPRHVASARIDHQKRRAAVEADGGVPASFEGGAVAAGGEVGGRGVVDAVAALGGFERQAHRQHVLPTPGRPTHRRLVAS